MKISLIILALFLLYPTTLFSKEQAVTVALIINKSNDLDNITSSELARIYKGRNERWPNGSKIVILNRPIRSPIREFFYKTILDSKPTKKFFRLGSPIPFSTRVLRSDLATRKYVSRVRHAIGYIRYSKIDDSVKILKIDDHAPEDRKYILKRRDEAKQK